MTDPVIAAARQIRLLALRAALAHGAGHIGSSLSCADILAVLYAGDALRRDEDGVRGDRFVLSKGHAATALYAALAVRGEIDGEEMVEHYTVDGSAYAGHAEHRVPGVEASTGSLGHGLSLALGMALSDRIEGSQRRSFCLLGDGELGEGSVWEAVALAGHLRIGPLTAIVDANGLQGLGHVDEIGSTSFGRRFAASGWQVDEVDGHDCDALGKVLRHPGARPRCVIARTIKGRGIPSLEGTLMSHYRSFRGADAAAILAELEAAA
ncbi:MAG TPA: 1-deoxy-D-xylulose-5-phosphate synthase N-terminal domain-containing protein [Gaiellales bacterium]|jgi:transketolase